MASSSYNPYVTVEVGEEYPYPYPSHVCASNSTFMKLNGRGMYNIWKTQMLCLLESHDMLGFIDGTLVSPQNSVSGKEKAVNHHRLWRRSDALVKTWIFGSLSEQTFRFVLNRLTKKLNRHSNDQDFTAKDVWDELHSIYAPSPLPQMLFSDKREKEEREVHQRLYRATIAEYWDDVNEILRTEQVAVMDKITGIGDTTLHVAVGTTKRPEVLEKLLERVPDNTQLLDVRNSNGSTVLHIAAIIGNMEAARILVGRNSELLYSSDNEGQTPLAIALSNMHTETSHFLLDNIHEDTLFSGRSGDELLVSAISSKDYRLASKLFAHYKTLRSDAVMMAMAQNFPCELKTFEEHELTGILHWKIKRFLNTALDYMVGKCVPLCGPWVETIFRLFNVGVYWMIMLFPLTLKMLELPFIAKRVRIHRDAEALLWRVCKLIRDSNDPNSHHHYYTNPIFEATRLNVYEVVEGIVSYFPTAFWSANEDDYNFVQYAVINRSEKVYNLVYQMRDYKNVFRTIKDSSGNNLLHLAARLAPANKLTLISGAALQLQRELQWFEEVERFVCPINTIQKNSFDETPQMVFTREHKNLVIEGEKWMKITAESYTITAALITTVVFAAAITVPGGNNQATGTPLFTNKTAFTIFAIADAISLFASVTSLLMFLSILTARFAEQDFLFKLPKRLMMISTTTMIVAFGATLYLVFGHSNSKFLIPIVVLTCLPIASFVALQFPLVVDLVSATYGRNIFGKQRDRLFY